jgi:hypothetical protein
VSVPALLPQPQSGSVVRAAPLFVVLRGDARNGNERLGAGAEQADCLER